MASLVATVPNAPISARCFLVRYLSPARGAHARMRKHLRVPYAAGRPDSAGRRKPRYQRRAGRGRSAGLASLSGALPHAHASAALLRACHDARGAGGQAACLMPARPPRHAAQAKLRKGTARTGRLRGHLHGIRLDLMQGSRLPLRLVFPLTCGTQAVITVKAAQA